jgi:hypothetical protein
LPAARRTLPVSLLLLLLLPSQLSLSFALLLSCPQTMGDVSCFRAKARAAHRLPIAAEILVKHI